MNRTLVISLGAALAITGAIVAVSQGNPDFSTNGLEPQSEVFRSPVTGSEQDELTIVSFNIRDIRGTVRTLEDFQEISRLIAGADIVVFQEMGAKGFGSSGNNDGLMERLQAATAVMAEYLGDEWQFKFAESPTPEALGAAAEIPCVGYRSKRNGLFIDVEWSSYYDLGEARDMGTFSVKCKKGGNTEVFTLGSVHTKPTCPERGEELLRIADYIEGHENDNYILLGDFNWGYYSTCTNKYDGENRIAALHDEGKVFQLFHDISYTGKGKSDNFRTNLDLRSTAQMYDQFLICKNYAGKMAEGGVLGEDCGFISFSTNEYFQSRIDDHIKEQLKGVKAYMKSKGFAVSSQETQAALKETEDHIRSESLIVDEATYNMSDHKPIWMRIKMF